MSDELKQAFDNFNESLLAIAEAITSMNDRYENLEKKLESIAEDMEEFTDGE